MYFKSILIYLFFTLFLSLLSTAQDELELKRIVQLKSPIQFELSGMAFDPKIGLLMIADNVVNVYRADTSTWTVRRFILTRRPDSIPRFDLEGIDISEDEIFILNEADNMVYQISPEGALTSVHVNYKPYETQNKEKFEHKRWGNMGYEGFAINLKDKSLYLAKERASTVKKDTSRFLLTVNLADSNKLVEKFNYDYGSSMADFTEIKYVHTQNKKYLYALERNLYYFTRIDLDTKEVTRFSFKKYMTDEKGMLNLYDAKSAQYGIAESFVIMGDEIWIGVDNNNFGIKPENTLAQKFGLSGIMPSIFIFKRPKDF
jgi:hypothetical protein